MTFDKLISSCKSVLTFSGADAFALSQSKLHAAEKIQKNTSEMQDFTYSYAHKQRRCVLENSLPMTLLVGEFSLSSEPDELN